MTRSAKGLRGAHGFDRLPLWRKGTWNLEMRDCYDGKDIDPALSMDEIEKQEWLEVEFPEFVYDSAPKCAKGPCLVIYMEIDGEKTPVTTVFDIFSRPALRLIAAMVAMSPQITRLRFCHAPAWQEKSPAWLPTMLSVAREFAEKRGNNARSFTDYRWAPASITGITMMPATGRLFP